MFGAGSKFFGSNTPNNGTGTVTGGNNGVIDASNIIQLGQPVGTVGNPAVLLHDTEIPMANHRIFFGLDDGVSNVIGFDANQGISLFNNTGQAYQAFWQIAANTGTWKVFTDDAVDVITEFSGGGLTSEIIWNGNSVDPGKFVPDSPWIFGSGIGQFNTVVTTPGGGEILALTEADSFLIVDTTAGNLQLNIDVVANKLKRQRFIVKKISSDVNTITLNMIAGTIQEIGAPAASFAFNVQGQSVEFICDDLNAYII